MNILYKKIIPLLILSLFSFYVVCATPSAQVDTDVSTQLVNAESGILMEASTGEVLYQWNPDKKLQIASVTKTMTMLLIMEALESGKINLNDIVTTSENAASMGGSQVFLEVGEQMSVDNMLKSIAVASGNDAAVAMAEHIGGSHQAFVEQMNKRANQLGCANTNFINCTGLDETSEHYSTARDIAIISRELLKHPKIFDYTTIWMDTIRDGAFGLSNTNKLIRFYNGANGLKTGSTSTAKYCLSATALRDGMQLIAVVLCAPSTSERFGSASALLDFGFANYSVAGQDNIDITYPTIPVLGGTEDTLKTRVEDVNFIVKKGNKSKVTATVEADATLRAPIQKDQKVGEIVFSIDGQELGRRELLADISIEKLGLFKMFAKLLTRWVSL